MLWGSGRELVGARLYDDFSTLPHRRTAWVCHWVVSVLSLLAFPQKAHWLKTTAATKAWGLGGPGRLQAPLLSWAMGQEESPELQSYIDPVPTECVARSGQSPTCTPVQAYIIGRSWRKHKPQNRNIPWLEARFPELLHILIYIYLLRCLTVISSLTCAKQNSCFVFPPHTRPGLLFYSSPSGKWYRCSPSCSIPKLRNHAWSHLPFPSPFISTPSTLFLLPRYI